MKYARRSFTHNYIEAFSWQEDTRQFLDKVITERPLLNVCSGPNDDFGDCRVDAYVRPVGRGVMADWIALPFKSDSFAAVFADPPWNKLYMKPMSFFCKEALRVAPIAYVMSPWLWVGHHARRSAIWVREFPGVNIPILIVKYERSNKKQCLLQYGEDDISVSA
jgi:hypothetical protein